MLKIDETFASESGPSAVYLRPEGGAIALVVGDEALPLPAGALPAVMARYGAPVDPAERLATVATLELGRGRVLRHVRHLGAYDVIARDYLVYEAEGAEPLCALAVSIAAPLVHLARAASRRP
jgi:hypothetical protein